jgi:transposase
MSLPKLPEARRAPISSTNHSLIDTAARRARSQGPTRNGRRSMKVLSRDLDFLIAQRGNGYLRMLLIHGARTALPGLAKKDTPLGRWLKDLLARAHRNIVIVALANKLARIAWAVLARDRQYVAVQVKGS